MATVTALEAKNRFGRLLARVLRGEEIVITRHEKPVAKIVPAGERNLDSVQRAVADLRALQDDIRRRAKGKAARLSAAEVRAAIDEGRL